MRPFPLTPALSRREREERRPRWVGAGALGVTARFRGGSLSQRERVRVRENGHEPQTQPLRHRVRQGGGVLTPPSATPPLRWGEAADEPAREDARPTGRHRALPDARFRL